MPRKTIDRTGLKYGKWRVLRAAFRNKWGHMLWYCVCECGAENTVSGNDLHSGKSLSCGCVPTHGHTKNGVMTETYKSWATMIARCTNPKEQAFKYYGAIGVAVCSRWLKFENFLADMGERPAGMTLDRKENAKGYSKRNCRWATRIEQANNRSTNVRVKCFGTEKTCAEWGRDDRCAVSGRLLSERLRKGWPAKRALTESAQRMEAK